MFETMFQNYIRSVIWCFKYRNELHVIANFHIIIHEIAKVDDMVAWIHLHEPEKGRIVTEKGERQRYFLINLSA